MASALTLASWLKNKFKVEGKNVALKENVAFKMGNKEHVIPSSDIWCLIQTKKDDKTFVTGATPIISHTGLLKLAEEVGIHMSEIKTEWLQYPKADNMNHAIVQCTYPGVPPVIGEANAKNLNAGMQSYPATIALKRGIDRIITHVTGLYTQGFYSSSELGGDFNSDDVVNENQKKEREKEAVKEELRKIFRKNKGAIDEANVYLADITGGAKNNILHADVSELKDILQKLSS